MNVMKIKTNIRPLWNSRTNFSEYFQLKGNRKDLTCGRTILWICALHLPIQVHTHTAVISEQTRTHTHPEQWAAIFHSGAGEQLGVRWLEMSAGHSLPLQFLLVQRLEPVTCGLQVRLSKPGISYPAPGEPSCRLQFQLCCNTHVCNYQVALNTLIGLQLKSAGW